jgi:hypothetical protein
MAREITVTYNATGGTLYATFRRVSDAYAWDGSGFEVFSAAAIGDYDVALTDGGGDIYYLDWPTSMPAGNYHVVVYEQAGASPATTDQPLTTYENVYWSGTVASSGSSVVIDPYALCTLDQVKRDVEEDSDENDTLYVEIINAKSAEAERVMGRRILQRAYRQRYNGVGQRRLVLREYPAEVMRIAWGAANALSLSFAAGSAIRANAAVYRADDLDTTGGLRLRTVASNGTATTTNLSFATYGSVSALATAANLVSGWTATVLDNQPSADLNPGSLGDALGRTVYATYPDVDEYGYRVDGDNGIVTFDHGAWRGWAPARGYADGTAVRRSAGAYEGRMPYGHQEILVEFQAGFSEVPSDINLVVRELVRNAIYELDVHPSIQSLTLGHASATFSADEEDYVRTRLSRYIDASRFVA